MTKALVLDTGPIVGLAARSPLGEAVRARHLATASLERPMISVVSLAECRAIASFRSWGADKRESLEAILGTFTVVGLPTNSPLLAKYVEMYAYLRSVGRNWEKNQNDLWIGALAAHTEATLITTDFKLAPLVPRFFLAETYDPSTGALRNE